jgi:acetyltransferase-like isoleucine patch superfamily enzyme
MTYLFNTLYNVIDMLYWKVNSFSSTIYVTLLARIRGIPIGAGTKFFGITRMKRSKTGSIVIGKGNNFRSSVTSNPLGICKPCIFNALEPGSRIIIGDNCSFSGTSLLCAESITIGNNVKIGPNTMILDWCFHPEDSRCTEPKPIMICDNAWLGFNVAVMRGVTIGENTIIGAGSIVTKDIPANVVAAGCPCVVIRQM